jgi:hypothetical protein
MQLSHKKSALSATFDDTNLVSAAGLKVTALVAGMVAGADSIDDMRCCATAG